MIWPFGNLAPLRYSVLLIDPPWQFKNWSKKGEWKNASRHYRCMPTDEICRLPIGHLAAPHCAAVVWATAPMLEDAMRALKAWGFEYKSMGCWAKRTRRDNAWQFGGGYIMRGAVEPFLIGTIGDPTRKDTKAARSVRNLIVAPVREHSRKPDQMFDAIEALYDGPYAEVFSRTERPGWDCWGDEVGMFKAIT